MLKGARARVPPIETFDEIITELENQKKQILTLEDVHIIGWLKIYVSSLRNSLSVKADQWIDVYTNFLLNQVKIILTNL